MRPAITLTAEELDRLLLYLGEVPARMSFDAINLLMTKRQMAEAEAARPEPALASPPPPPTVAASAPPATSE